MSCRHHLRHLVEVIVIVKEKKKKNGVEIIVLGNIVWVKETEKGEKKKNVETQQRSLAYKWNPTNLVEYQCG